MIEVPITEKESATKSQFYRVNATKNQSQLMIFNLALSHFKKMPFALSIYADFGYLESAFSQGWIDQWKKNGWKNAKNEPVGNAAMWQEALILLNGNEISWHIGERHSYKNSIDMMGFKLGVNAQSRNEFANSKTSQYMQSRLKRFFIDKMRMARNLEEIVNVGDGYTWEDIKHYRKDKLIGFVRGNVQIRVGNNDYIADIVLANDKTKGLIFYDIVNMKSTVIKKAPTERTHENHAAQVVGASKDSISKTGKNATQIVKTVAQKGRKSVKVDSSGRKLSEGQVEYFKDTKVVDENGNLTVVYHGSPNKFTVFDAEKIGTRASAEGYGFYFTDNLEKAEGYHKKDGNVMEGYLDIQNPLSLEEVTIKRSELKKLLENLDPTGDDILSVYDASGVGYPSRACCTVRTRTVLRVEIKKK